MKKIFLILCCVLMLSCSDDTVNQIIIDETPDQTDEVTTAKERLGIWYEGFVDDELMHMQFSLFENRAIGKYYFDNDGKEILIKGTILGDSIEFIGDDGSNMIITNEENRFYGVYIHEEGVKGIYGTKEGIELPEIIQMTDQTNKLQGTYTGLNATMFVSSTIRVYPLFNHLLYIDMTAVNGRRTGQHHFLVTDAGSSWKGLSQEVETQLTWTDQHEIIFDTDDATYNCDPEVAYDHRYSESYRAEVLDGLTLNIVQNTSEERFLKLLLEDDYEKLIKVAQNVHNFSEEGYDIKDIGLLGMPDVLRIASKDAYYYVILKGLLYDDQVTRIYSNDLKEMPLFLEEWAGMNPIKTQMILTQSGFKVQGTNETVESFIPDGYSLKDQVKGHVNDDLLEDVVLVLDAEAEEASRILMVLLAEANGYKVDVVTDRALLNRTEGGAWGDPYESIELIDHKLMIGFYGGSNYRWAYHYTYDCLYDYKLINVETMNYLSLDLDIERLAYDLVTDEVIQTIENDSDEYQTLHRKKYKEVFHLETFNIDEGINYEYQ